MMRKYSKFLRQFTAAYQAGEFNELMQLFRDFVGEEQKHTKERAEVLQQIIIKATEWSDEKPTAEVYFIKAYSFYLLGQFREAVESFNESIKANPNFLFAYYGRGAAFTELKEYDQAIADYNKTLEFNPNYDNALVGLGIAFHQIGDYNQAIENFDKAIAVNSTNKYAYSGKGFSYNELNNYELAINCINKAIEIDPKFVRAFYGKGLTYYKLSDYNSAIDNFTTAIKLEPNFVSAYFNRGLSYDALQKTESALADYSKVIELNPNSEGAYYNRARLYYLLDDNQKSLDNYRKFIETHNDSSGFFIKKAESRVVELLNRMEDPDFNFTVEIVNKLKELLSFKEECITHYTSLSTSQLLILKQSSFRLSEAAFLNDTSEGRELFKYLELNINIRSDDDFIAESFVKKPFIGSFVSDKKHDDLTLWRMYGKEKDTEAKGCAFTIKREDFIKGIVEGITSYNKESSSIVTDSKQFTFYKVAYWSSKDNSFTIPDSSEEDQEQFNHYMKELKKRLIVLDYIKSSNRRGRKIIESLNEIVYLFKTAEYQYEHEVRLVIDGLGFEKHITDQGYPPRVYIELTSLIPILNQITLGPKVERADEWAAAFYYSIKNAGYESKVVISHLPYK